MKSLFMLCFWMLFVPFWLTWAAYEVGAAIEQAIAERIARGGRRDGR